MGADWNVLVTLRTREKHSLRRHETSAMARHLKRLGDFQWTKFLGVLVGRVEDHDAFFTQLMLWEQDQPGVLEPLARVVPIEHTFEFTVETFSLQLKEVVLQYVASIDSGSFYVRLERRGHKGEIHSPQVEQDMDHLLLQACEAKGWKPVITFEDPDIIIVVETLENICGVGTITRALRSHYPFIRVP